MIKSYLSTEENMKIEEAIKNKDWELLSQITHANIEKLKMAEQRKSDNAFKEYTVTRSKERRKARVSGHNKK